MLVSNFFIVLTVQLQAHPEFRVPFFIITVEETRTGFRWHS